MCDLLPDNVINLASTTDMRSFLSGLFKARPQGSPDHGAPVVAATRRSACYAPSVNMLFATDGSVRACCHNSENTLGRYPDQTISQIWQSDAACAFRQAMSDFTFLSGCRGCELDYRAGLYDHAPARHFDQLPQHPAYPTMMEFLLSNTCNLECTMCSGELSSSIRKNRDKLPPLHNPYGPEFLEQLREFLPYLHETRFSGAGEAFSIDLYYDLWRQLTAINPACLLVVQTNGTILNARVRDILEQGNFQIGVSLDSLQQETFEAIRIGASFDTVMRNIDYFAAYSRSRSRTFTISACVMRQNWHEMPALVAYSNQIGAHVIFHKVWSPRSVALYNLPAVALAQIHATLTAAMPAADSPLAETNLKTYQYFLSVIARWQAEAAERELHTQQWNDLSTGALYDTIDQRIADYIHQQDMLERNREELIALCRSKFAAVVDLWESEENKRSLLLKLVAIPVSEMITSLKVQPIERLYEMSRTSRD